MFNLVRFEGIHVPEMNVISSTYLSDFDGQKEVSLFFILEKLDLLTLQTGSADH